MSLLSSGPSGPPAVSSCPRRHPPQNPLPFQTESTAPDTLEALGAAIDLRDAGSEGHSRRVCRFALQIAKAMGLSEAQHKTIAMGAYLHTESGRLYDPQVT